MMVQEQYTLWRARAIDDPDLTAELAAIEQDADVVIALHREGYYDPENADPYLTEAIVLKNRKGQTGTVYLQWLPEFTSFGNRSNKSDEDD